MQIKALVRISTLFALILILPACTLPNWMPMSNHNSGQALAAGEQTTLHFFTNIRNFDTGVSLQAGQHYQIDVKLLSNWIDSSIELNENDNPLDEKGFDNSIMPYQWLGLTRRSRTHNWFELMLVQPNCKNDSLKGVSELTVDEATGNYNFIAACDGNLSLFVNDTYGFYSNNTGYASIVVSRV